MKALKFPSCPSCGSRDVDLLWATCKTARIGKVRLAPTWPGGREYDFGVLKDGDNGLLIQYGIQCVNCEKHWFETPGQKSETIKDFAKSLADLASVPTRLELDSVSPAPTPTPAPAPTPTEPPKVWVLTIHARNDLHYLMPDEYTAREKLVEVVNEWADEISYPETQAYLDKGMGQKAVDAFFERESDKTKFNYTLDLVDAVGFGENRLSGCRECGYSGYSVFNKGDDGKPYGEIQACDSCQAKNGVVDDVTAAERAGDDGYELFEDEYGHYIILKRPEDTDPVAAVCSGSCKLVHKVYDMTHVHGPSVDEAYYCDECWVGVRTEEDPR